jgi:NaMN:DMB phosphoribosyltransferase
MEWEALLLGLEPVAALTVGIAALVLAPVIGTVAHPEFNKSLGESGRNLAKNSVKLGLETYDSFQSSFAEATESWNALVAEAKAERETSRNAKQPPAHLEIV